MYIARDELADNTAEIRLDQEHLVSNHFKFWTHVHSERESGNIGNWVNGDVVANESHPIAVSCDHRGGF